MQAIAPNALDRWHEHLALAIRRLRQPDFLAALVDAIHQLVPIESSMISLERKGHAPTLLYERGIAERFREAIIRRYFSRGYLLDPFCLAVEEGLPEGFYTLGEIAPTTSSRAPTTRPTTSAPERWRTSTTSSTSALPRSSRSVSTTAFRRAATATPRSPPSPAWRRRCWSWPGSSAPGAPTSPNPQADLAPRLQEVLRGFGRDVLTDREREACHLLLSGHSAKSSARLMDISPETVRMHRKNLYTKLEVGSQSELFALFIECLSQGQRVGP